jgi:hypothetical protein
LFKHNLFIRLTSLNIRRHACEGSAQLLSKEVEITPKINYQMW